MKRYIKQSFVILVTVIFVMACKKTTLTAYEQPDMVYIYKDYFSMANDSLIYSFAIKPATLMQDTVKVPVRIMGLAKNTDRTVNVVVADSSTAKSGQHYELLPTIVKAGQYTANIPVLVKRSTDLQVAEVTLFLEIKESNDFQPGIPNTAPVNPKAGGSLTYKIRLNDILTKPSNWDTRLTSFFGTYSKVKYLFIIQTTGIVDFPYGTASGPSPAQMTYYNILCKTALAQYNATHSPLMDENGNAVTFP